MISCFPASTKLLASKFDVFVLPHYVKPLCASFEADVAGVWSYEKSAESRDTEGGSSRRSVLEQCAKLRAYLEETEGEMEKVF